MGVVGGIVVASDTFNLDITVPINYGTFVASNLAGLKLDKLSINGSGELLLICFSLII